MTKIQLKRSNVLDSGKAKKPTAEQTEYGELCVNYNVSDPSIFIKDSNNNIVKIAGNSSISSPDVGSGTITIQQPGTADQTFNLNQNGNTVIALKNDNTVPSVGNGTITIVQPGTDDQTFSVNQSGNTTIELKNDNTVTTPGDGRLYIRNFGNTTNSTGIFTANQSDDTTLTLPQISYSDISGVVETGTWTPTLDNASGVNVTFSSGYYVQHGDTVNINFRIDFNNGAGNNNDFAIIMPFTATANNLITLNGGVSCCSVDPDDTFVDQSIMASVNQGSNLIKLLAGDFRLGSFAQSAVEYNDLTQGVLRGTVRISVA